MNPECITHSVVNPRRPFSAPSSANVFRRKSVASDGVASESLPLSVADVLRVPPHPQKSRGDPLALIRVAAPQSTRPASARRCVARKTASGHFVVESAVAALESSAADINPRALYHHAHVFQFSAAAARPKIMRRAIGADSLEQEVTPDAVSTLQPPDTALTKRLRSSEEKIMKLRAVRHAVSAHHEKNNPASLQLYLARLSGQQVVDHSVLHFEGGEAESGASSEDEKTNSRASSAQLETPLSTSSAAPTAGLLDAVASRLQLIESRLTLRPQQRQPSTIVEEEGTSVVLPQSSDPIRLVGRNNSASPQMVPRGRTEERVHLFLQKQYETLQEKLASSHSSEHRRESASAALERLNAARFMCRSATTGADFLTVKGREAFRQHNTLAHLTAEELQARLLYGEAAKRIALQEHQARTDALSRSPRNHSAQSHSTRNALSRQRRLVQWQDTKNRFLEGAARTKEKAATSHTSSFHERVSLCERQVQEHRAAAWVKLVRVLLYPRSLLRQRAANMQRLLLAAKKKEEHIQCFVEKMRGVLTRRRRRIAVRTLRVLRMAFTMLMTFFYHRRRRRAVGEVVAWYEEFKRWRPATDIIRTFKRAIVRCQRLVRAFLRRRRMEVCWVLARMVQLGDGFNAIPPKQQVQRRSVTTTGSSKGRSAASREGAIVERIAEHVMPPFEIRLRVARQVLRKRARHFAGLLKEHLRLVRLDKEKNRQRIFCRQCDTFSPSDAQLSAAR